MTINPYGAVGLGVASVFSVIQEWSLPEFCWSTWLAGLIYAWGCIVTAIFQIILTARSEKASIEKKFPFLRRLTPGVFLLGVSVIGTGIALIAFRIYNFVFAFYGLFLSVFAEMEPLALFGRNGFINADFYSPLIYLVENFWPMSVGVLIMSFKEYFLKSPWKRILLPLQEEVVRMHIMILSLPFFSLLAWAVFREAYQSITIVLLMSLFYLFPKKTPGTGSKN